MVSNDQTVQRSHESHEKFDNHYFVLIPANVKFVFIIRFSIAVDRLLTIRRIERRLPTLDMLLLPTTESGLSVVST